MLSTADNETISRVGPGTPMGEVFRRFWLPVMSSSDLESDGSPRRLRILGEDLVGFRDTTGQVGILQAACPHRRAKLFWGRNEDCGLRCAYHGWKFAVDGRCVDMPTEPPGRSFEERAGARSYPTREKGGLVWAYMGPRDLEPAFPNYQWITAPLQRCRATTWLQRSNWLQSLEGDLDTAHVSFLHRWLDADNAPTPTQFIPGYRRLVAGDTSPRLEVKDTPSGLLYGGRRTTPDGRYYWRVSHWMAPCATQVPGNLSYRGMRFLTPIDDHHSVSCSVSWQEEGSSEDALRVLADQSPLETYTLPDGYIVDVRVPPRSAENDFEIDREAQRTTTFSGIPGGPRDQDRAMTETMGALVDRSEEHLGATDVAIVALRQRLLRLAHDLEAGIEPPMATDPDAVADVFGFDALCAHERLEEVLGDFEREGLFGMQAQPLGGRAG